MLAKAVLACLNYQMGHVVTLHGAGTDGVRVPRQSDFAFEAIYQAIVRCEIMPGAVISEIELSNKFGVGRAAARAAVDRLTLVGLLHPIRRQGYRVKPITLRDLNDLFQLREIVEVACVRMVAGSVDAEDLARLDRLCRADYVPGNRESEAIFLRRNSEFHLSVAAATRNDRVVGVLRTTLTELERMFHFGLSMRDRGNEMYAEHQALIEALASGDVTAAEKVTIEQIRTSRAMVLDAFLSSASLLDIGIGVGSPTGGVNGQ